MFSCIKPHLSASNGGLKSDHDKMKAGTNLVPTHSWILGDGIPSPRIQIEVKLGFAFQLNYHRDNKKDIGLSTYS